MIGVPVRDSFPGLERAEHGLRPVRVDTAFGFVFVCLAGDPPPVRIGIAMLKQLKKTRLVEAFERHCQAAISETLVPGMAPPRCRHER